MLLAPACSSLSVSLSEQLDLIACMLCCRHPQQTAMKFIAAATAALAVASGAAARSLQQAPAMAPTAAFTPAMPAITDADIREWPPALSELASLTSACHGVPLFIPLYLVISTARQVASSDTALTPPCMHTA